MKIHFIGIGGAGMIPLALFTKANGHDVTGSDLNSENFDILRKDGIEPVQGHSVIPEGTVLVVYSSAVKEDNPEMKDASQKSIRKLKRAEYLGEVTNDRHCIMITGSHGKSTTAVMLADMMINTPPYEASALVGAEAVSVGSNFYNGNGDQVIIEADEYDKSFLKMHPTDLIILNIDDDHLDVYKDMDGLKGAFSELISKLGRESVLVYNGDDKNSVDVCTGYQGRKVSFGLNKDNDYRAENIIFDNFSTIFEFYKNDVSLSQIEYIYSGTHNVYNMLACLALLSEYGTEKEMLRELADEFCGIKRRQEIIYRDENYILIDDYAHHPTEIKRSLSDVAVNHKGRKIALFQPHLYSRTKQHAEGFANSFDNADRVLISQIYPAREKKDPEVNSGLIFSAMKDKAKDKTKVFSDFENIYGELLNIIKPGDLIISLGAGEINKVLYKLKKHLENETE